MIAFIADLHLQQGQPETLKQAVAFVDWAKGRCKHLYILGDLFEYWLGDDHPLPGLESFDAHLKALSNTGCAITIMHGNRDFLLGEDYAQRVGATLVRNDHIEIMLGDRKAIALHGDTLCTDDTSYQQARLLLRSDAWQKQFTALPLATRKAQALALRQQSKNDSATKSEEIMDINDAVAATLCITEQTDLLIHGHTHRPDRHIGQQYERVVLGDWNSDGAYVLLYDNSEFSFKHWPFDP